MNTQVNNFIIKPSEIEHIENYRKLDNHGMDMINTILEKEFIRCTGISEPINIDKSYLDPVAAHERTDIELTEEMKQYDALLDELVSEKKKD